MTSSNPADQAKLSPGGTPRSKATIRRNDSIRGKTPKVSPISRQIYFITLSNRKKNIYVSKHDIDRRLLHLMFSVPTLQFHHGSYELGDVYGQLHYHAIVTMPNTVRYKGIKYSDGFYLKWIRIPAKDLSETIKYVNKESHPARQDQIHTINWYRHHYGFIDDKVIPPNKQGQTKSKAILIQNELKLDW